MTKVARPRTKRKAETPPDPDEVALEAVPPYLRVYLGTRALEVGEALILARSTLADHVRDAKAHDSKRGERRSPDTCPWCADARLVETEIATAERIQRQGVDHDRARGAQLARLADDPAARPDLAEWTLQHAIQGRSPFAPPPHDPSRVNHHIDRALEAGQRLRKVWPNEKAARDGRKVTQYRSKGGQAKRDQEHAVDDPRIIEEAEAQAAKLKNDGRWHSIGRRRFFADVAYERQVSRQRVQKLLKAERPDLIPPDARTRRR